MIKKYDKKAYLKEIAAFINKYPDEVWSKIYELEEEFKNYFWVTYASACSSWSTWLLLSLKAIWIKKWDEIMLSSDYFISDPNSIVLSWGKPIFIDLWENINSLSIEDIKSKITKKTKAIIIIHLYWYPVENTIEIINFCKSKNIIVIEDCCQSIWAKIWNNYIWTFWDLWIFSFDTNKMVKWWEWWIIISNNKDLIEKTRLYKNNCKEDWKFIELGFNYRYNDFSAIYTKYSLKNLENIIKEKITLAQKYWEILYKWWENISPSFYNFIVKKENNLNYKKDFYNLNIKKFPNLIKHSKNYEII